MKLRHAASRWTAWAFALALLLKAALPLLATSSAQVQGKALVEVCTVYGVATVALDGNESRTGDEGTESHAAGHCVLSALVAFAASAPHAVHAPRTSAEVSQRISAVVHATADARAAWLARLKHAPPVFA